MQRYFILILLSILLVACSGHSKLEDALEFAGDNRIELEKVLQHYSIDPCDSLKLQAAQFLIENMPHHYYFDGPGVDSYYEMVDSLFAGIKWTDNFVERGELVKKLAEDKDPGKLTPVYDSKVIKADMLISHIDHAFKTREYPWNRNLSFEDFCEYVLPYRLVNEPIEDWMPAFQEHLKAITDSLIRANATDTAICRRFIAYMIPTFPELTEHSFKMDLRPTQYINLKAGTCHDINALGAYTLRSLGIPVRWDFTQWANRGKGHEWNAIWVGGKCFPFQFGESAAFGNHLKVRDNDKLSKVYRKMYSAQDESLVMQNPTEAIPPLFRDPFFKDVSELYYDCLDIDVELTFSPPVKKQYVYLMIFDNQKWTPVHWAGINDGKARFTKIKNDIAYLAMYYHNNKFYPAAEPFYIDTLNKIVQLVPDINHRTSVTLKRKYPNLDVRVLAKRLPGGRFQAATRPDFKDTVNLHTIGLIADAVPQYITFEKPVPCRYFRYLAPDKSWVFIAEIEVYDTEGRILKGEIIGTEGSYDGKGKDKTKVFDGDYLTFFDAPNANGGWVGLIFPKKELISGLMYLPRNDDNYIRENEQYELYYYDKDWVSLGQQTGTKSLSLIFDNVPSNALLLLKNHTKGVQERIFTYENGKQVWW